MAARVLILHAAGVNRDEEAARACRLAGGVPEIRHINELRRNTQSFLEYDVLVLPGGFSYGDALGAGVRMALDLTVYFGDQLDQFIAAGRRVLGICNGFQALVKSGHLPGWESDNGRTVTLTENRLGRFECRWVHLSVNTGASASFLAALDEPIFCPVAHGEGNFQVADGATLERLEKDGLVAFRYAGRDGTAAAGRYPTNPNGSAADIAGLCNAAGNVVGLMPHPEDHLLPIQNPLGTGNGLGLALFQALLHG